MLEPIKSVLKLDFEEAMRPWVEMRELLRVLGGEPKTEIQAAPLVLEQPERRQRVVLQVRAITLEQDVPSSADQSSRTALDLMARASEASKFPKVTGVRYELIFIKPFSLPLHELVALVKQRFLQPNPLVELATDVGLIFDQHEDNVVKHIEVGPMEEQQLRTQYLKWPPEDLPPTFLFVGLAYAQNQQAAFGRDLLANVLNLATEWQLGEAGSILNLLESEG